MENSNFEKEKDKKSEIERMIQQVRSELLLEKQQLQNTADIADVKIEEIGEEEAELWLGCKAIKTDEDYNKFEEKFNTYRNKILEETREKNKEAKEKNFKNYLHPKGDFVSVLGNKMTYIENKMTHIKNKLSLEK